MSSTQNFTLMKQHPVASDSFPHSSFKPDLASPMELQQNDNTMMQSELTLTQNRQSIPPSIISEYESMI